MKWLKIFIWFSLFSSCCIKNSNINQDEFSKKEIVFLAKNCEYIELVCSQRMINIDEKNNYVYDKRLVDLLKESDCFIGVKSTELVSKIGEPSVFTDLLIGYTFLEKRDSKKFIMVNFGLEKGVVTGKAVLSGDSVGSKTN